MNLWINLYEEQNDTRLNELVEALDFNLRCTRIKKVFALCDSRMKIEIRHEKLIPVRRDRWKDETDPHWRPTYQDFFSEVNYRTAPGDINIVANSDISFDETLVHLIPIFEYPDHKVCAIISRREENDEIENHGADAWVFRGKIDPNIWGNFFLGVPACDWAIFLAMKKAGYTIVNPSLQVRGRHHHASGVRNYTNADYVAGTPYGTGHILPQKQEAIMQTLRLLNQTT